jgi:hypothetical protein
MTDPATSARKVRTAIILAAIALGLFLYTLYGGLR